MSASRPPSPFLLGPVLARSHASRLSVPHHFGAKRKRQGSQDLASGGERPFRRRRAGRSSSHRDLRRRSMAQQLEAADPATRLEIARKLAPCARTPLRLILKLEAMGPEVSDFVLEHAVAYSERELKEAIARGARQATAVARRKAAEPRACEPHHIPRRRRRADRAGAKCFRWARKSGADPSPQAGAKPGGRARRPSACGSASRAPPGSSGICASLPHRAARPAGRDFSRGAAPAARPPARLRLSTPATTLDELEVAAVARQPERFVAMLAEALDCDPDLAQTDRRRRFRRAARCRALPRSARPTKFWCGC